MGGSRVHSLRFTINNQIIPRDDFEVNSKFRLSVSTEEDSSLQEAQPAQCLRVPDSASAQMMPNKDQRMDPKESQQNDEEMRRRIYDNRKRNTTKTTKEKTRKIKGGEVNAKKNGGKCHPILVFLFYGIDDPLFLLVLVMLGNEKLTRSFSDRSSFMDVRAGCPFQNACFFQDLERLTEVFGQMFRRGRSGPVRPKTSLLGLIFCF